MLDIKNLTVGLNGTSILDKISFSVESGQWLMITGPNGAGKSTIINAISQGIPYIGEIAFESQNIKKFRPKQLAGIIGVLSQSYNVGYGFTVEDIVRLGRYAYTSGIFSRFDNAAGKDDDDLIESALEITGMGKFRARNILTLSGGELQRTFLAQVMAQDPRIILLDEPSNHLDLVYQKQMFELIGDFVKRPGKAVISVVHDLSLAKLFGSHALLIDNGRLISFGSINQVLTSDNLDPVYKINISDWMRNLLSQWNV